MENGEIAGSMDPTLVAGDPRERESLYEELREAQRRMRESEEKYRMIMDNARDYAILMLDKDGIVTTWNCGAEKMLGYSESEAVGRPFSTLAWLAEDVRNGEPARELELTAVEGRAEDERWHLRKDSSRFFASGVLTAVRDADGHLKGYCKIMRDSTPRKLAEDALRQSRENYVSLIDSIDGILWEAEGEGRTHTFVSKKAEELLGYPLADWYRDPHFWESLIAEEDRPRVLQTWDMAFRERKGYTLEYRMVDSQGRKKWFRDYVTAVSQAGSPPKLRAVLVEITSQRAAEKRQEMQLKVTSILATASQLGTAGQEILAALCRGLEWDMGSLWSWSPQKGFLNREAAWNSCPEKLREIPWPAVISQAKWQQDPLGRVPETGACLWIPDLADAARQPLPPLQRFLLESGMRACLAFPIDAEGPKMGMVKLLSASVKPVEADVSGITISIGSQIGQFMERMRTEEALRLSQEQFLQSQKMEAIGRLAGGVAHDFNNLLTAINGYSELGLAQLEAGHPLRPNLEEIRKAGRRAASLTNQLLAYSRKQVLAPRTLSLNTIVADMGAMLKRLIGEDITLKIALASDLGQVKIDPGQMEQVILNLVVNARDAMPNGGTLNLETRNVEIGGGGSEARPEIPPGRYSLLCVTDTGRGMDEGTQARLFEPFFTTKEVGKGTGLGLSTVYGIMQQSGGHVSVRSRPGQGSAFSLYLPLCQGEGESPAPRPEAAPEERRGGRETLLLVEDEEGVLNLAREILSLQGYRVLAARGGKEALHLEKRNPGDIHLLVTDFVMEGMNGREVYEALRERRPGIKVLYMSGYTNDTVVRRGLTAAGPSFLQKPFTPQTLVDKVYRLLHGDG